MATGAGPFQRLWTIDPVTLSPSFSISCKTEVHFGVGLRRKLADVMPNSGQHVVLVKGKSNRASASVRMLLSNAGFDLSTVACTDEPSIQSVNDAYARLRSAPVDCIVACGGGSVIDTGKALVVALERGGPLTDEDFSASHDFTSRISLIVLPTTAGTGSEVTSNAVLGASRKDAKISLRGKGLQPTVAIVDPDLMRDAPDKVVLYSGLDAVVQNIEAYTSSFATSFTRALSGPAIESGLTALRDITETNDQAAWTDMAWASLASGIALANGGLGAVHGIASVLGGAYDAPHGALCGRLLIPVLKANLASERCTSTARADITNCQRTISELFPPTRSSDPYSGLEDWLKTQGLPRLSHWGIEPDQVDALAAQAVNASSSLKNPVKLETRELSQAIHEAL